MDTSELGDLSACTLIKPYRESGQFATFGDLGTVLISCRQWIYSSYSLTTDRMNYSVNIYDDGNLLSIVTTGGMWNCWSSLNVEGTCHTHLYMCVFLVVIARISWHTCGIHCCWELSWKAWNEWHCSRCSAGVHQDWWFKTLHDGDILLPHKSCESSRFMSILESNIIFSGYRDHSSEGGFGQLQLWRSFSLDK